MADISKIILPSGDEYNLKDSSVPAWAKAATKPSYTASEVNALWKHGQSTTSINGTLVPYSYIFYMGHGETAEKRYEVPVYKSSPESNFDVVTKGYVDTAISGITIPTNVSDLTNDAGYITSYTETDPVFTASAAAGITSTDINNWNAKVSDDKTWNGISISPTIQNVNTDYYAPVKIDVAQGGTAYWMRISTTPTRYAIAKYDANASLNSTTPAATDNSTKVATTAYVTTAISNAATTVTQTLTSGIEIATINGTKIYAPSYPNASGVSF